MPLSVIGLLASNSAANEWCACTAPAVSINAARMPPNRYLLIFTPSTPQGADPALLYFRTYSLCERMPRKLWPIVLAEINRQLLAAHPPKRPGGLPVPRVGRWIAHRHLVFQRVEIGPGEALDQTQLIGVRQAAVR